MYPEDVKYVSLNKINPFDDCHTKVKDGFHVDGTQTAAHRKSINFIKKRILEGGEMRPILVMKMVNDTYERLDGFCRYWAYKELGKDKIPCVFGFKKGGQGNLNPFMNTGKPRLS